jgi:hypothetical protein
MISWNSPEVNGILVDNGIFQVYHRLMAPDDRYRKFDANGRFGLIISEPCCSVSFNDDLGRGGEDSIIMFGSDEARGYFVQIDKLRRDYSKAFAELDWLRTVLRHLRTPSGRIRSGRMKQLMEWARKTNA